MRSYKTPGIILARRNFSESDKILTILTPGLGKIVILAKGIRRINSRRAPHLELFNEVGLVLHRGKTFDIVTESKIINNFPSLRQDLKLIGFVYYSAEVLERILPERQKHEPVYYNFQNFLKNLSIVNTENIVKEFVVQLLWELGYLPKGQYPKMGVTNFVESIIERKIRSKKFIDQL
ncbi:MAG: DNA repair protein RecO [Patescibacteria group bacterium]